MFVHVPVEAVSVLPWVALPLIVGGTVFTGVRDRASDAGVPGVVGELPDEDEEDDGDEEDDLGFSLAAWAPVAKASPVPKTTAIMVIRLIPTPLGSSRDRAGASATTSGCVSGFSPHP
ncbi:MAG: hypothetical protein WBQ18_21450 [Solirubrobacteraceae bacterium]